jgi:hypothetical protein
MDVIFNENKAVALIKVRDVEMGAGRAASALANYRAALNIRNNLAPLRRHDVAPVRPCRGAAAEGE